MEAVEKHFRETHLPNLIKPVESHTMSGPAARQVRSPGLQRLLRAAWEEQRRFPLKLATTLSQQFAARGLQFFKVNRSVTFVSVARPHYLDMEATPVSEGVRRIVEFINATTKCTRKKLVEALVPSPPPPAARAAPIPAAAPADGAKAEATAPVAEPEAAPEQTALASDLHWLVHQGHVIEFANGILETAKKPVFKPPKPQPKAPEPAAAQPSAPADQAAAALEAAAMPSTIGADAEAPAPLEAAVEAAAAPDTTPIPSATPEPVAQPSLAPQTEGLPPPQ